MAVRYVAPVAVCHYFSAESMKRLTCRTKIKVLPLAIGKKSAKADRFRFPFVYPHPPSLPTLAASTPMELFAVCCFHSIHKESISEYSISKSEKRTETCFFFCQPGTWLQVLVSRQKAPRFPRSRPRASESSVQRPKRVACMRACVLCCGGQATICTLGKMCANSREPKWRRDGSQSPSVVRSHLRSSRADNV